MNANKFQRNNFLQYTVASPIIIIKKKKDNLKTNENFLERFKWQSSGTLLSNLSGFESMLPSHIHAKKWFSERNSSLAVSSLYPELVQLYKAGRNYTNHWDQCLSIKSYQSSKKKKKKLFQYEKLVSWDAFCQGRNGTLLFGHRGILQLRLNKFGIKFNFKTMTEYFSNNTYKI